MNKTLKKFNQIQNTNDQKRFWNIYVNNKWNCKISKVYLILHSYTYMRAYPCSSTYTRILNLGEHILQPLIDSHPNFTCTTINDLKITSLKLV